MAACDRLLHTSGCGNVAYICACLRAESSGTRGPSPSLPPLPSCRQRQIRSTRGRMWWKPQSMSSLRQQLRANLKREQMELTYQKMKRKKKKQHAELFHLSFWKRDLLLSCHISAFMLWLLRSPRRLSCVCGLFRNKRKLPFVSKCLFLRSGLV